MLNIAEGGGLGTSPWKTPGGTPFALVEDASLSYWSTGFNLLGANVGILAGPFIPALWGNVQRDGVRGIPFNLRTGLAAPEAAADLSWNLGGGFFVRLQEQIYFPWKSQVTLAGSSDPGVLTASGAYQTSVTMSYINGLSVFECGITMTVHSTKNVECGFGDRQTSRLANPLS